MPDHAATQKADRFLSALCWCRLPNFIQHATQFSVSIHNREGNSRGLLTFSSYLKSGQVFVRTQTFRNTVFLDLSGGMSGVLNFAPSWNVGVSDSVLIIHAQYIDLPHLDPSQEIVYIC
jgi:hypothetical protein